MTPSVCLRSHGRESWLFPFMAGDSRISRFPWPGGCRGALAYGDRGEGTGSPGPAGGFSQGAPVSGSVWEERRSGGGDTRTEQTGEERGMDKRKGNMIRGILVAVILVAVLAAPLLFGGGSGAAEGGGY